MSGLLRLAVKAALATAGLWSGGVHIRPWSPATLGALPPSAKVNVARAAALSMPMHCAHLMGQLGRACSGTRHQSLENSPSK